ncbi:MAG TPA: HAD family phosphatase [Gemmatimonadales bacterium]|nr:HAD family phosphatase [Gemmatimonadales bacterium]
MEPPSHVFFDIGGVLGTNGWDTRQRAAAAAEFGLDGEFDARHREIVGDWELGRLTLDEYLDIAVFYEPRTFSREAFQDWMKAQSRPFPESVRLARRIAEAGRVWLFTLNNESAALNQHRIDHFGLAGIFDAFLSSCWLGVRKPTPQIYATALAVTQATPERSLFIDDRAQNLAPAAARGMRTILYRNPAQLEAELQKAGLL